MNVIRFIKEKISMLSGVDNLRSEVLEIKNKNETLASRVATLEERLVETSRAIATLAIAHASVVRELAKIMDLEEKKREKKLLQRKTSDDFTN